MKILLILTVMMAADDNVKIQGFTQPSLEVCLKEAEKALTSESVKKLLSDPEIFGVGAQCVIMPGAPA
jgi:hypothetical protein